jgi:hypothetical protein
MPDNEPNSPFHERDTDIRLKVEALIEKFRDDLSKVDPSITLVLGVSRVLEHINPDENIRGTAMHVARSGNWYACLGMLGYMRQVIEIRGLRDDISPDPPDDEADDGAQA